jgi:hypothetical protein
MVNEGRSRPATSIGAKVQRTFDRLYTFVLSALAVIEPMIAATSETYNPVRRGAVLLMLILMHLLVRRWLLFTRELWIYIAFTAYMGITLIWAPSVDEGLNTLFPALDFILMSLLIGSLVAFHDLRAVIMGAFGGFIVGAASYTISTRFPFQHPDEFSYNAVAGMYLFGLFITLVYGWYTRSRLLPVLVSLVIMVHIAATTSIKTNLGIALGAGAASLMYVGTFFRVVRANIILLVIFAGATVYTVSSNAALLEQVQFGLDRVSSGIEILRRRDDLEGHTSFGDRADWQARGIKGWLRSPMFGNGVEAFRMDYGITSHSTPIDLLYNFGVVGFALFYAIFASIVLRLMTLRRNGQGSLPALIFAGIVCYVFITLSGTMHYNAFLAVFISVSVGLLRRAEPSSQSAPADNRS